MPKRQADQCAREAFLKGVLKRMQEIPDAEVCLHKAVLLRNSFLKVKCLPKHEQHDAKRQRVD